MEVLLYLTPISEKFAPVQPIPLIPYPLSIGR